MYKYKIILNTQCMEFRCGLIGLGRIGCGFDDEPSRKSINTHAGAYTSINKAKLVALCDIDETKLNKYGKKYNVSKLYTDFHEMIKNERLDCVSICTLADSHLEIVKEIAKSNVKAIFLEKPISDSLQNASNIIQICNEMKIKLQIDHQRRFDPFYQEIQKTLKSERFGKIQHVNIYYGGGIANTGSHIFDLLRMFFGNIVWVEGNVGRNSSNSQTDPNIDGRVFCENNVLCNLQSLNLNNYGILELDILGEKERLRVNLVNSTVEYFEISDSDVLLYKELKPKMHSFPSKSDSIILGLDNLLNSIENNAELLCAGEDGYASLEAVIAIQNSAKNKGIRVFIN